MTRYHFKMVAELQKNYRFNYKPSGAAQVAPLKSKLMKYAFSNSTYICQICEDKKTIFIFGGWVQCPFCSDLQK